MNAKKAKKLRKELGGTRELSIRIYLAHIVIHDGVEQKITYNSPTTARSLYQRRKRSGK